MIFSTAREKKGHVVVKRREERSVDTPEEKQTNEEHGPRRQEVESLEEYTEMLSSHLRISRTKEEDKRRR